MDAEVVPVEPMQAGFEQAAIAEPVLAIAAVSLVVILGLALKWGLPQFAKLRQQRYDIERYRIEVDDRAAQALDDRERERIRTTQALADQQKQTNENTKALTTIMSALQARLEESATRSHEMGEKVGHIESATTRISRQVDEIHEATVRRKAGGHVG